MLSARLSPGSSIRAVRTVPVLSAHTPDVPIGNGRALISLERTQSIAGFELELVDALAQSRASELERQTLGAIVEILRQTRRSHRSVLEARTIIVFQTKRQRRRA